MAAGITQRLISVPPAGVPLLRATDVPRYYWLVSYRDDSHSREPLWSVVIAVNQKSIEPAHALQRDFVYLGIEQGIFVLARSSGQVVREIMDVICVGWFEPASGGLLLVAAEDEVLALDSEGHVRWRQTFPDVLEDLKIEGDHISIEDMSGRRYAHDLASGCRRDSPDQP